MLLRHGGYDSGPELLAQGPGRWFAAESGFQFGHHASEPLAPGGGTLRAGLGAQKQALESKDA